MNISDFVTISNLSSKIPKISYEASKCSRISLVIPSAIYNYKKLRVPFRPKMPLNIWWNTVLQLFAMPWRLRFWRISSFDITCHFTRRRTFIRIQYLALTGVIKTFLFKLSWMSLISPMLSFSINERTVCFLSCKSLRV